MRIREALLTQSPSLALQRQAADEIAALDAMIIQQRAMMAPRIDYTKLYEFAESNRLDYNQLCAAVNAAIKE